MTHDQIDQSQRIRPK